MITRAAAVLLTVALRVQRRQEGATAVEYGLLVAFIGVAFFVGSKFVGQNLHNTFNNTSSNTAQP